MFGHLGGQQVGVHAGVHGHEGFTEARREGGLWLFDADLGPRDLGGVSGNEVVGGLLWREPRNGREHAKGVAGQENDVLRVTSPRVSRAVVDEFDWVGATRVLRLARVVEVRHASVIEDDVFQDRTEATGGPKDGGLIFFGEVDELGVAAALEVEHAVGTPPVFIVAHQGALWVGGKGGFPGAGQAEENGRVFPIGVGGTVHGKDALLGENEVHHRENRLLDFAGVAAAADDDFFGRVVDDDEDVRVHPIHGRIGLEMRGMKHGELRLMRCQTRLIGAHEHVSRKGAVPCVVRDHTDGQGFRVLCTTVQVLHEKGVTCLEEGDDFGPQGREGRKVGGHVDVAPIDVLGSGRFVDNEFVVGRATRALSSFGHQRTVG